ncbi:hypothetical protein [Mesorhizobium sp. KR2-14]|uniref:hypothetical protein n=1 Tax=Mesorhizobium sp. KR2-14 TaxID=3156610 RepID=UPI0032B4D3A9
MDMRDAINLVEGLNIPLNEVFDNPLALAYNHAKSEEFKAKVPNISAVFVYDAEYDGQHLEFYRFKHKQCWEVHFNHASQDYEVGTLGVLKKTGLSRIIATAVHLLDEKATKGNPIRYYAQEPDLRRLYDLAFKHLNDTKYRGRLGRMEDRSFRDPWGRSVPAVLCHMDRRNLPVLPNESIDKALAAWDDVDDLLEDNAPDKKWSVTYYTTNKVRMAGGGIGMLVVEAKTSREARAKALKHLDEKFFVGAGRVVWVHENAE